MRNLEIRTISQYDAWRRTITFKMAFLNMGRVRPK